MPKYQTYNGHKNWNHWNVSLWINGDDGLYSMAKSFMRSHRNKESAAKAMLENLQADVSTQVYGGRLPIIKTPDGAPYSVSSIRAAMVNM
jgi:hypothetical protein